MSALRDSVSALLDADPVSYSPESIEAVRREMLAALGEEGAAADPMLCHRIQYATTPQALWFARVDVVVTLCPIVGEEEAVERVQKLAPSFKGLVSKNLLKQVKAPHP